MFQVNKHDVMNSYKYQKLCNQRWKSKNQKSNYKTDNDIFNIKANKNLENGRSYKKIMKDISESQLDRKMMSTSPFIKGKRNEDYISNTYRSQIFGEQSEKRKNLFGSQSFVAFPNGAMNNIHNYSTVTQELESARLVRNPYSTEQFNLHLGNTANKLRRDQSCESVGLNDDFLESSYAPKTERIDNLAKSVNVTTYLNLNNSQTIDNIDVNKETKIDHEVNSKQKDEQPQPEKETKIEVKVNRMSKSVIEPDRINVKIESEKNEEKLCYNCYNQEVGQNHYNAKHRRKLSDICNKTSKNIELNNSQHEEIEKYKDNLISERIKNRQNMSLIASKSYVELKRNNKNQKSKEILQENNQKETFFFHKDKRDDTFEKAKMKYELKEKLIQNLVDKKIYVNDLKPGITNYYKTVVENSKSRSLPEEDYHEILDEVNKQKLINRDYHDELNTQIKSKQEKIKENRFEEKKYMNNVIKNLQEREDKEQFDVLENIKNKQEYFIKGNLELLELKKKKLDMEKEKMQFERDKDRKMHEIYARELIEIKQKNDKFKKLMFDVLTKQIEEKKKRLQDYKEERNKRTSINSNAPTIKLNGENCSSCKKVFPEKMLEKRSKLDKK